MRKLGMLGAAMAGIVVAAVACSSDEDDDDDSGVGSGTAASPGVVGHGTNASTAPARSRNQPRWRHRHQRIYRHGDRHDATRARPWSPGRTPRSTPASRDSDPEPYNVVLMFVVDVSGSMTRAPRYGRFRARPSGTRPGRRCLRSSTIWLPPSPWASPSTEPESHADPATRAHRDLSSASTSRDGRTKSAGAGAQGRAAGVAEQRLRRGRYAHAQRVHRGPSACRPRSFRATSTCCSSPTASPPTGSAASATARLARSTSSRSSS